MNGLIHSEYPRETADYTHAGEASADIKRQLKQLGVSANVMRRVAVASGVLSLDVYPDSIVLVSKDRGPGIPNLEMAMKEGYSTANEEARALGFGAGMGLPNMKRNADGFEIQSEVGVGTEIRMSFKMKA